MAILGVAWIQDIPQRTRTMFSSNDAQVKWLESLWKNIGELIHIKMIPNAAASPSGDATMFLTNDQLDVAAVLGHISTNPPEPVVSSLVERDRIAKTQPTLMPKQ